MNLRDVLYVAPDPPLTVRRDVFGNYLAEPFSFGERTGAIKRGAGRLMETLAPEKLTKLTRLRRIATIESVSGQVSSSDASSQERLWRIQISESLTPAMVDNNRS